MFKRFIEKDTMEIVMFTRSYQTLPTFPSNGNTYDVFMGGDKCHAHFYVRVQFCAECWGGGNKKLNSLVFLNT